MQIMIKKLARPVYWSMDTWKAAADVTAANHVDRSIDLDSGNDKYQTGVAQFRHAVCHYRRLNDCRFYIYAKKALLLNIHSVRQHMRTVGQFVNF